MAHIFLMLKMYLDQDLRTGAQNSTQRPTLFPLSYESNGVSVQEKKFKIFFFKNGRYGDHFGFPIGTIVPIFDLKVTLILPINFQVN